MDENGLAERIAALEQRVAALEATPRANDSADSNTALWALNELRERLPAPGGVVYAGNVQLSAGPVEWQYGATMDQLLDQDWTEQAAPLAALGHPVRLAILHAVINGVETVAELTDHLDVGTTGQVYHHIRELTGARWLTTKARGHYQIPPDRVVPILIILTASRGTT